MTNPQNQGQSGEGVPLADLVLLGKSQKEAIAITDDIFMSQDVSNCYLVTSDGGDVLINAGTLKGGERHKALFAAHRKGPLTHIILTQGHPDHYSGVPILREAETLLVAQKNMDYVRGYWNDLGPHYTRRLHRLWRGVTGSAPMYGINEPTPDVTFDATHELTVGGRRFVLYATPSGETLDSLIVWLPEEKVLFTGNVWGPVYMSIPNFGTIRGDKLRSIRMAIVDLELMIGLKPEILITGHGEPIRGAERIAGDLTRMKGALEYIYQATVAGMNAGKDVFTLMREIRLPDELSLLEHHGSVAWAVRTVYQEYTGWFHFGSTTELYDVPFSSVNADIVELVGGPDRIAERAAAHIEQGQPLEALHLVELSLDQAPGHSPSLAVKLAALEELVVRAGDRRNLSETMWLKGEIAATRDAIEACENERAST